jgi:hypothetical protein
VCIKSESENSEVIPVTACLIDPVQLSNCQTCLGSGSEFKLQTCLAYVAVQLAARACPKDPGGKRERSQLPTFRPEVTAPSPSVSRGVTYTRCGGTRTDWLLYFFRMKEGRKAGRTPPEDEVLQ